jgi:hypothetical protein
MEIAISRVLIVTFGHFASDSFHLRLHQWGTFLCPSFDHFYQPIEYGRSKNSVGLSP